MLTLKIRFNKIFSATNGSGPTDRHGCLIWRVHYGRRNLCYLFRILEVAASNTDKRSLRPDKRPLRGPLRVNIIPKTVHFSAQLKLRIVAISLITVAKTSDTFKFRIEKIAHFFQKCVEKWILFCQ